MSLSAQAPAEAPTTVAARADMMPAARTAEAGIRSHRRPRLVRIARRHAGFLAVAAAGLVLRILVMVAYPQAFWFTDSSRYLLFSYGWQPDFARQAGYSLVLKALRQTGALFTVSGLQHLLGLAIALAVYALLQRRGVPRWLSVVAACPVLFDAFALTVEHFVLAETFFTTLIAGGLLALLWPARPTTGWGAVAGVLLALSATLRGVSLPLVALTALYLLVCRAGWRPLLAFTACAVLPLGGYAVWFHQAHGTYSLSTLQGAFLYGRVAPIADCEHLRLTPAQRAICPSQPLGHRTIRSDWYVWSPDSPAAGSDLGTREGFVVAVFTQQPGEMLRVIATDTARYLVPMPAAAGSECSRDVLLLPRRPPTGPDYSWCTPNPRQAFDGRANPATLPGQSPLTHALGGYAQFAQTPRLVLGTSALLVLATLVWRPRRRIGENRTSDLVLLGGWGLGLLILAVLGSMFDERYGVPSLALLPAAGALALHRLRHSRRSDPTTMDSPQ